MVRRVLKDNKVPRTSSDTSVGARMAEALGLAPAGSAARFLGESQAGL